jgi:hypothetical protein
MYNIEDEEEWDRGKGPFLSYLLQKNGLRSRKGKNAKRWLFIQEQNERLASTVPTCKNQCILVMANCGRRNIPRVRDVPSAWHGCLRSFPVRYL